MPTDPSQSPAPGRPVVLTDPPAGLWPVLIGAGVALLAPFFGFLIGTAIGPGDPGSLRNPIYLGLFIGVLVGAVGVLVALLGARTLYRALSRGAQPQSRAS